MFIHFFRHRPAHTRTREYPYLYNIYIVRKLCVFVLLETATCSVHIVGLSSCDQVKLRNTWFNLIFSYYSAVTRNYGKRSEWTADNNLLQYSRNANIYNIYQIRTIFVITYFSCTSIWQISGSWCRNSLNTCPPAT